MRVRGTPFRLRIIRDSMWGGIALGADIALFFSAVKLTSIVNATIIGSMQPIVVGVIAARFFGERIGLRNVAWSVVALTGTVVVVAAGADDGTSDLRGDLLALAAMLSWSAYFIASKNSKKTMTSTEFTAGTALWTMAICAPLGFVFGQDMSWPSATNWGWLVVMAASSGLIGHAMMNWSLVRIPLWVGSTFTLLIPVFSALLAWVVLDEAVTLVQGVAMAVVIGSLAVVVRNQSHPGPRRPHAHQLDVDRHDCTRSCVETGTSAAADDVRPGLRRTPLRCRRVRTERRGTGWLRGVVARRRVADDDVGRAAADHLAVRLDHLLRLRLLIDSVPIMITNGAIAAINVWFLRKEFASGQPNGRDLGVSHIRPDSPFLADFVAFHLIDIHRFQPDFRCPPATTS